jgi:hypothetical protein
MKARTVCIAMLFFSLALGLGASAEAQLPKQGAVTAAGIFAFVGDTKEVAPGRVYQGGIFWGGTFNEKHEGILDNAGWYCTGAVEILNGLLRGAGECTIADADGDKIFASWKALPYGNDKDPIPTENTYRGGTGKFAGISGGMKNLCLPLVEGPSRSPNPTRRAWVKKTPEANGRKTLESEHNRSWRSTEVPEPNAP